MFLGSKEMLIPLMTNKNCRTSRDPTNCMSNWIYNEYQENEVVERDVDVTCGVFAKLKHKVKVYITIG